MKSFAFFAVVIVCACAAQLASAETIRAYHIGNSLTDNIHYGGVRKLAEYEGDVYKYGKQSSPGTSLDLAWQYKSKTGTIYSQGPYGKYKDALKNYTWDVLTLEPFENKIAGTTGDLQMSKNFINYALPKSPNVQTYIYERWPRRPVDANGKFLPFDYAKLYTKPYAASTDRYNLINETRGYFESLTKQINSAMPNLKKKVKIVPVGDVLLELDKRIKANQITGIDNITDLYADAIHFNNTGAYVLGLTFYATMFKQSPMAGGPTPGSYGGTTEIPNKLASQLQDTVWDIVKVHPYAGVKSTLVTVELPEPSALGALLVIPLLARRRAR